MEEIKDVFKTYTFTCRYCYEEFIDIHSLDRHEKAHKVLGHERVLD